MAVGPIGEYIENNIALGHSTNHFNKWKEEIDTALLIPFVTTSNVDLIYIVFKLNDLGHSSSVIKNALNDANITSQRGGLWREAVVTKMLNNSNYKEAYDLLKDTTNIKILNLYEKVLGKIQVVKKSRGVPKGYVSQDKNDFYHMICRLKFLENNSNKQIASILNTRGYKTKRGKIYDETIVSMDLYRCKMKHSGIYNIYSKETSEEISDTDNRVSLNTDHLLFIFNGFIKGKKKEEDIAKEFKEQYFFDIAVRDIISDDDYIRRYCQFYINNPENKEELECMISNVKVMITSIIQGRDRIIRTDSECYVDESVIECEEKQTKPELPHIKDNSDIKEVFEKIGSFIIDISKKENLKYSISINLSNELPNTLNIYISENKHE